MLLVIKLGRIAEGSGVGVAGGIRASIVDHVELRLPQPPSVVS